MINQLEIPMYLEEALPAISQDLAANKKNNVYEAMNTLMTYMCRNIKEHNYKMVKRCLDIADKLYTRGNAAVKDAVQNVFVYSFTKVFHTYTEEKPQLLALLPMSLYTIYISQVHHGGC